MITICKYTTYFFAFKLFAAFFEKKMVLLSDETQNAGFDSITIRKYANCLPVCLKKRKFAAK